MAWFLRGVQSAVFHYASCAPCTGYADGRKRRKAARIANKAKEQLQLQDPHAYQHPPPTGTNPYWEEEIRMGPGPPPRRARKNNGTPRCLTTAGTQHSAQSKAASTLHGPDKLRLSDDTADDDTWNHKRYQREDEHLWGIDDAAIPLAHIASRSSAGGSGFHLSRPDTSRSASYYSVRAPPVNDLHPPVVSMPSPNSADNRWMLQPPPKASVMAGREPARNRSRSGSAASSRVELNSHRRLSTRHAQHKLERGQTPEMPSISRNSSYSNIVSAQRRDTSRTRQPRRPSASSSHHAKRRDTALSRSDTVSTHRSSGESTDTMHKSTSTATSTSTAPDVKIVRTRNSRPLLSTVLSSGSNDENASPLLQPQPQPHSLVPKRLKAGHMSASSADATSLSVLQDLVEPGHLLKSRFVSAPLVEAKIRLPIDDGEDEDHDVLQDDEMVRVPFDQEGKRVRDPRLRWSVDF
ncbi:hypothetical protein ACEQ8H_007307 [Pleosporales sp. CAS-2024a]